MIVIRWKFFKTLALIEHMGKVAFQASDYHPDLYVF